MLSPRKRPKFHISQQDEKNLHSNSQSEGNHEISALIRERCFVKRGFLLVWRADKDMYRHYRVVDFAKST